MKNKLLILGAGGHGNVVADTALKMKHYEEIVFLDDNRKTSPMGLDIVGKFEDIYCYLDHYELIVAIGDNAARQQMQNNLESAGAKLATVIHPSAVIGESVEIGRGTVVMAGVIINCCTKIGKGCIINTGSTIDHDNEIEDYVHISPGVHVAGSVKIGKRCWLGIGSIVSNNISITRDCMIGAGAVVVKDLHEPGTYVGVPVRRI